LTTHDTLIVGAGPAGLAVTACLKKSGRAPVLLERANRVGASWRAHYDRLHLHTPKSGSALPFLPFPDDCPRYPSRQQVIDYLEAYAAHFDITPRFGQQVVAVRPVRTGAGGCGPVRTGALDESAEWQVCTTDAEYRARYVVVATGYNREPYVPTWPGQDLFRGAVLHSSAYRNGAPFHGQDVLVVGFGNSGGEIALDLCEHGARVALGVRGPVNIVPREILGIPAQRFSIAERALPPRLVDAVNGAILRLVRSDMSRYGLQRSPIGPATQIAERGRIPLIDIGTVDLITQGRISVLPGIARFKAEGVVFTDGSERRYDAVVLATGYRPRVDTFLEDAAPVCDGQGTPRESGSATARRGLFFCGFRVTATGALREIGLEARRIAAVVREQSR
jgi:cation diffusion facilitator CzcD-associated flavoprotein CzcO